MRPLLLLSLAALALALPDDDALGYTSDALPEGLGSWRLSGLDEASTDDPTEHDLNLGVTPLVPVIDEPPPELLPSPLIRGCPKPCDLVGPNPSNWTVVHHQAELVSCEAAMIFDFNVHNPSIDTFRACIVEEAPEAARRRRRTLGSVGISSATPVPSVVTRAGSEDTCGAAESELQLVVSSGPAGVLASGAATAAAVEVLSSHLVKTSRCGKSLLFAKVGTAVAGLYVSADVQTVSAAALVLDTFKPGVQAGSEMFQSCDANSMNPYTIGLFAADDMQNLPRVQAALKTWSMGECIAVTETDTLAFASLTVLGAKELVEMPSNSTTSSDLSSREVVLSPRADCRVIRVQDGNSCASLAVRCGIKGPDFMKYNTNSQLCATLKIGQYVCCSSGTLPDMRPKPDADGTCATHEIEPDEGCWSIAESFGITQKDIETFNKGTWGWAGCDRLQPNQIICLSKGNTPMPAQLPDVACGPQKQGTRKPSGIFDGWDLAKLNSCPLRSCCSGWGYCGTTAEFCTESKADTGAPGAFKPGESGCISNCGTEITNNDKKPAEFKKIGYFQGYNGGRDCLRMDATQIGESFKDLTHVHFAFAGLTADLDVNIAPDVKGQFDTFIKMKAPFKKIISFGGWAESTDPETFQRYRDSVTPANRERVASNVLRFMNKYPELDGVDFDWEYPGATDQGIPSSNAQDAILYNRFLSVMQGKLAGSGRSLSIAIPASFWYLKPFPVAEMTKVLDYFIYMTYDLHGQWDYGNKFANPGCPNGNCLRSHVNITETENALVMITKAGVPAEKVIVGITSYGRSFRMADKSCTGPHCLFTGSRTQSDAEPGICTGTGGYISNAELLDVFAMTQAKESGYSARKWYDAKTGSDIMTYGTRGEGMTDWVAFMSEQTKAQRTRWIEGLNFGGTTDWAVDLSDWVDDKTLENQYPPARNLACNNVDEYTTLEDLEKNIGKVAPHCRAMALVGIIISDLEVVLDEYNAVSTTKDYDDRFWWYADWVKDSIDARLEDFMKIPGGEGLKYTDCEWESVGSSGSGQCTEAKLSYPPGPKPGRRIVEYKMRDEEGFYKALLAAGIEKEWVTWRDDNGPDTSCAGPCEQVPACAANCGNNYFMRKNFPRRINDKDKIDIPNPKKIIDEAIPSADGLMGVIIGTYIEMQMNVLEADEDDVINAFTMPLFMLQDASKSIAELKKIGKEHKETKTRDLILMILTIVFAVIPFAGAAVSSLGGAARIATGALIIGEAGNAAISIYEVIEDPTSAPFAILGMLVGAAGMRSGKPPREAFREAGKARQALTPDLMKAFSDEFRRKDGLVQNIVKSCKV
ncbi:hypothetical protein ACHAQA_008701 [Verticillium albo-atrum]